MDATLEREAGRLAASLRAVAADARRPLGPGESPAAVLSALAERLDAAAADLETALIIIAQAHRYEARLATWGRYG